MYKRQAYTRARRRAEHMMAHGRLYQFNVIGLALCGMHIRWKRRRHYFCSPFVSEVLEKSGAMELPKHSTLMPVSYTHLDLGCQKIRVLDMKKKRQCSPPGATLPLSDFIAIDSAAMHKSKIVQK